MIAPSENPGQIDPFRVRQSLVHGGGRSCGRRAPHRPRCGHRPTRCSASPRRGSIARARHGDRRRRTPPASPPDPAIPTRSVRDHYAPSTPVPGAGNRGAKQPRGPAQRPRPRCCANSSAARSPDAPGPRLPAGGGGSPIAPAHAASTSTASKATARPVGRRRIMVCIRPPPERGSGIAPPAGTIASQPRTSRHRLCYRSSGSAPVARACRRGSGRMELALDAVTSGYGGIPIVREVSLEVGTGEIVAIVGRNGVGKTTLIETIAGLPAGHGGRHRLSRPRRHPCGCTRPCALGHGLCAPGARHILQALGRGEPAHGGAGRRRACRRLPLGGSMSGSPAWLSGAGSGPAPSAAVSSSCSPSGGSWWVSRASCSSTSRRKGSSRPLSSRSRT